MAFRDQIKQTDEYQEIATTAAEAADQSDQRTVDSPAEAVEPVMSLEKSDLEFWMMVSTVVLLFLIYREMSALNRRAVAQGLANGVSA